MTRSFSVGMARRAFLGFVLLASSCGTRAQEGFPLDGTWRGEWSATSAQSQRVVMIMKWNGHGIEGMINPGPNSIPFESAVLDPENWTLRVEAQARDGSRIVVAGKLDDIGSYHRTLTGTWTQGRNSYPLRLARE